MKLSKDAIKRIILILVIVGLFELYDVAKKHSKTKVEEAHQSAYVPKDTAAQDSWFKDKYSTEILKCVPNNKQLEKDPYLTKLAYLYQSQAHDVEVNFANAKPEDQKVVTQNQFYHVLNELIEKFAKDYAPKSDLKKYDRNALAETLTNTPYDPYINAAIHRIGRSDTRQTESYKLALNKAGIENKSHIVETEYFNLPSVQVVHSLLLVQFSDDEKSKELKANCFEILKHHPSVVNQNK